MKLLILYWGILVAAYVIASRLRPIADKFVFVQNATMAAVYILVLIMGLRMGVNEQVTSNLGSIGLKSLVITIFTVGGSMLAIFGVRKILKIDRYGSPIKVSVEIPIEEPVERIKQQAGDSSAGNTVKTAGSDRIASDKACSVKTTGSDRIAADKACSVKAEDSDRIAAAKACSVKTTGSDRIATDKACSVKAEDSDRIAADKACADDKKAESTCSTNMSEINEDTENNLDTKSTLIILALVIIGMLVGHFVIAGHMQSILGTFDSVSNIALVLFLSLLLAFVGFELGLSGNVAANIKSVGVKAVAFPFAAVLGTLLMGVISGLFFGFSVKEGIAISAGFGWYTYAPAVIAAAGPQYAIASAVSFMHNVIRETAAIILIPVCARKFGYLEATGMPGVAAMDVCMPVIERSCRSDTVVYSFAVGLLMCLTTSLLVPLVMGL